MNSNQDPLCDPITGVCTPEHLVNSNAQTLKASKASTKPKLTYYYDAYCGWCFGFSPVIAKIHATFSDQIDIEVISGGLFLGDRVGPINEIAPYVKGGAYKSVEARTGVTFGDLFLKDLFGEGKLVLNSLPPTIALCIVKDQKPEMHLKFAEMLLNGIYHDGLHPTHLDSLADYAAKIGFNKDTFRLQLEDNKYQIAAEKEYQIFAQSAYSGMPSLSLEKDGEEHVIALGYASFEDISARLEPFLAKVKQ